MLINVVPTVAYANLSAVVFSVVFEDLQPELSTPLSWADQIRTLRDEELDVPRSLHALDKSVGIICLLDEVTFDLSTRLVSCQFLDGSTEQWPLDEARCVEALERIVLGVNESELIIDREREREKEREKERERRRLELSSPPASGRSIRHKKQRSLLMTLVASIIPLYSPSSHSRLPSPPPTPVAERKNWLPVSPRESRRRARSELVDTFRRYALTELSRRLPRGGYYSWILQSMLRRALKDVKDMRRLAPSGGLSEVDSVINCTPQDYGYFSIAASSLPPTPSVSDDGSESLDTDTDGSSIQTPVSSRFSISQHHIPPLSGHSLGRMPTPLSQSFSDKHHATYQKQVELINHLRHILSFENTRQEVEDEELRHHHRVLEIRSRRRAWLNKALVGGVRGGNDIGMAMPFRSSPLASRCWSSEDYEYAPAQVWPPLVRDKYEYDVYDKLELGMKRSRRGTVTPLFPVSEESEDYDDNEDEALDARELELQFDGFGIDLEGGVRCSDDFDGLGNGPGLHVAFEIERPQTHPRLRRNSMTNDRLHLPLSGELRPVTTPVPHHQKLTTSSLLCQPLSMPSNAPDVDVMELSHPPVYTEVDVNLNVGHLDVVGSGGFGKYSEDEFTLSMDLPLSVRVQDCGVLANKRSVNVDAERGWCSARLSRPPGNLWS